MDTKLVIVVLVALIQQISSTSVICYHGTWSHYRQGNGKFSVSDVPAQLCTHYIYTFVGLDSATNKVKTLDEWLDIGLNGFADAVALKNKNPDLKVLLAVGGWNEGSAKYSQMAASASSRTTFVNSALQWVQKYNFDGFDLDWEYPARRDSTNVAGDKENFVKLIKEFHEVFHPLGLLVTAAVSAVPSSVDISYDVPALSKYLDFINLMLYDFHGAWDTTVSHNAPLYSAARFDGTVYAEYSLDVSVQGWLSRGASPSKLALGVPFYGRTFTLSSASNTAPGSASNGNGGPAGPYTATSGYLGYNEIIEKFNAGGWTTAWDDEQQVPYAFSGNTWLSYDNEASLALKVAYAKSLGLGAIMLWSLETEDFHGLCGIKYPLLKAINNGLDVSVQGWLSRGASPSKLALGVPFYGRTFTLSSASNTAPGSASNGNGGPAGPYTATSGYLGYNEIIEKFNAGGWTTAWDDEQQVPYAFSGNTWLSYDNEASLALKVAYAKSLGLGAIMLWSLETEDFHGLCGTKYPLLKAINNGLSSHSPSVSSSSSTTAKTTTTTTAASTSSSASSPTTSGSGSGGQISDHNSCTAPGYFRSSTDCSVFYYCQVKGNSYVASKMSCGSGLFYDTTLGICNYETSVAC